MGKFADETKIILMSGCKHVYFCCKVGHCQHGALWGQTDAPASSGHLQNSSVWTLSVGFILGLTETATFTTRFKSPGAQLVSLDSLVQQQRRETPHVHFGNELSHYKGWKKNLLKHFYNGFLFRWMTNGALQSRSRISELQLNKVVQLGFSWLLQLRCPPVGRWSLFFGRKALIINNSAQQPLYHQMQRFVLSASENRCLNLQSLFFVSNRKSKLQQVSVSSVTDSLAHRSVPRNLAPCTVCEPRSSSNH